MPFKRTVEDFTCEHCGERVSGTGFTNHCPECLWSKHVDIYPGDRAALCNGMMEPASLALEDGKYIITHRCTVCSHTKRNQTTPLDSMQAIIALSKDQHP